MYRRGEIGQVARALRVLDALRGFKRGRWISEVGREVGASERTVRRDINELQDAGFDIEVTRRDNRSFARLTIERTYSSVVITKSERFTLLAVRRAFDVFAGTPFLDDVHTVLAKLEQRMSKQERAELLDYGERVIYMPDHGTKSYAGKGDVIDAIQTGMLSRKVVQYRYADARGRARIGYLAPFVMVVYRHGLYAVGARLKDVTTDARTAPLGIFAIERFADAEHLRAHEFKLPKNLTEHLGSVVQGSFGPHLPDETGPHDIVVEFSREKALLVSSRTWHPSQQVTRLSDGRIRLELKVPALAPVVSWVLEWGPHVRVVSPDALLKEVSRESGEVHAQYREERPA